MKCEFYRKCTHYANDELCNYKNELCKIRKKILFRAISSSFQLEEEVEDMIQLNGHTGEIPYRREVFHEGKDV